MAKCTYCSQRKGKRSCPAVKGTICSQCCGAHRLAEINCPHTCSWLGGLQAVANPDGDQLEISQEVFNDAVDTLLEELAGGFGRTYLATALEDFAIDDEPAEWELPILLSYAAYALRDVSGQTFVQRYLEGYAREISPEQVATLLIMKQSWASLFEITRVDLEVALHLEDLITGEQWVVQEAALTSQVMKGDHLFGWIGERSGHLELTAGVCLVPSGHREAVRERLTQAIDNERTTRPDESEGVIAAELAWLPVRTIRDLAGSAEEQVHSLPVEQLEDPQTQQQIAAELRRQFQSWMDETIPALGDRTPREVAAAETGLDELQALVDELEARTLEAPGGHTVDFAAMREELHLLPAPQVVHSYKAGEGPDPRGWAVLDELERITMVERHHLEITTPHPLPDNPRLHATIHVVVENQLASGEPAEVVNTVARLTADGASRHEAVHAVGSVVAQIISKTLDNHEGFNEQEMAEGLEALDAKDWISTAPS